MTNDSVTTCPTDDSLEAWRYAFAPNIVGECIRLRSALDLARRAADTDCPILIRGETGTGKELFAEALHRGSSRRNKAFVAVNCASIPESLLESELFGHVKGAFTGATGSRRGLFVEADGGTLFLDEVGELSLAAQAKLLRVLQTGRIVPVGSEQTTAVDVRIVAATHRDLQAMVQEGTFRQDLYFRLAVIPLALPSLRERGQDVVTLADHFLRTLAGRYGRNMEGFTPSAIDALRSHEWPGNVRELANAIQRAVVLRPEGSISAADLGIPGVEATEASPANEAPLNMDGLELNLRDALIRVERHLIERALAHTAGNKTEAAALLGLNRTTLVEKIRRIAQVA